MKLSSNLTCFGTTVTVRVYVSCPTI